MKKIKLSKGFFATIDDEDSERVNQFKWTFNPLGYAYRREYPIRNAIYLHRFIVNAPEEKEVDHINGDKLDNRKGNLRICTHAENLRNMRTHKHGSSPFKGVSLHIDKRTNWTKWVAYIKVDGHKKSLGYYATQTEAALAYNEAARQYFGKFAYLNQLREEV